LGARSRLRSFLSSASYGGSPPALQCGQVCRTNPCFFFAAGAFTVFRRKNKIRLFLYLDFTMRKFFVTIIDSLSYLFIGGDEKEHDEIPFKEKLQTVIGWSIGIAFCILMMNLFLN
jgi:hypothetical protein